MQQFSHQNICDQLNQFSQIPISQSISRQKVYDILTGLAKKNGFQYFEQEIANQLCDRIEHFEKKQINIQSLAQGFIDAEETLNLKMTYFVDQEEQLRDGYQQISNLVSQLGESEQQFQGINLIILDEIKVQLHNMNIKPNLILTIQLGQFHYESEAAQFHRDNIFIWRINAEIELISVMDDLIIRVNDPNDSNSAYGQVTLSIEALPMDDVMQATFFLISNGENNNNQIMISCQLLLGNKRLVQEDIKQKSNIIQQKLQVVQEELQTYMYQISEINKPLKGDNTQYDINPKIRLSNQPLYSDRFKQSSYDVDHQINNQYNNYKQNNYNVGNNSVYNPDISNIQFNNNKMIIPINNNPIKYVHNQNHHQSQEYVNHEYQEQKDKKIQYQPMNPSDIYSLASFQETEFRKLRIKDQWRKSVVEQNGNNKIVNILCRSDIFALLTSVICTYQSNFSEFMGAFIFPLFAISMMLKKLQNKIQIFIIMLWVFISLFSNLFMALEINELSIYNRIVLVLSMAFKVMLLISLAFLLDESNLLYLKQNFLDFL